MTDAATSANGLKTTDRDAPIPSRSVRSNDHVVVIGGGPTGVELAGSIAERNRAAFARDVRNIKPAAMRVVLIEAAPRRLGALWDEASPYARWRLERLGAVAGAATRRGDGQSRRSSGPPAARKRETGPSIRDLPCNRPMPASRRPPWPWRA